MVWAKPVGNSRFFCQVDENRLLILIELVSFQGVQFEGTRRNPRIIYKYKNLYQIARGIGNIKLKKARSMIWLYFMSSLVGKRGFEPPIPASRRVLSALKSLFTGFRDSFFVTIDIPTPR